MGVDASDTLEQASPAALAEVVGPTCVQHRDGAAEVYCGSCVLLALLVDERKVFGTELVVGVLGFELLGEWLGLVEFSVVDEFSHAIDQVFELGFGPLREQGGECFIQRVGFGDLCPGALRRGLLVEGLAALLVLLATAAGARLVTSDFGHDGIVAHHGRDVDPRIKPCEFLAELRKEGRWDGSWLGPTEARRVGPTMAPVRFVSGQVVPEPVELGVKLWACPHCRQMGTLIGHGLVRGYTDCGPAQTVRGRRLFCSNRHRRRGCGRTFPVRLASVLAGFVIRTLTLFCFVEKVLSGMTRKAAWQATTRGALSLTSGYRLWRRLMREQSALRVQLCRESAPPACSHPEPLAVLLAHCGWCYPPPLVRLPSFSCDFSGACSPEGHRAGVLALPVAPPRPVAIGHDDVGRRERPVRAEHRQHQTAISGCDGNLVLIGPGASAPRKVTMKRVSSYLKMRVLGAIESAPGNTIVARIRHVSGQPFLDEDGRRFQFTWRTIQTWYSRYKKDGTTTVLAKPRCDKGKTRKMTPEEVLEAIEQVRSQFRGRHNVTAFYRACIEKGVLRRERIAPNTFRRVVKAHELLQPDAEVVDKRRLAFAKAHANELWQADTMVGPYIQHGAGKVQAKLIAFLDDASRVVCHGEFFLTDTTESLVAAFKTALYKRGVCECLYVDNGSNYSSLEMSQICQRLGTILCHTPVRDGAAKGKIERFFRTVRESFLTRQLDLSRLDALNRAFTAWLEDDYHQREHSSLGMKPIDRFGLDLGRIRFLPPNEVNDELFFVEQDRTVLADNTFSLKNTRFEAPRDLRSRKVQIRFDRLHFDRAIVYFKGERMGEARPVDFIANDRKASRKSETAGSRHSEGQGEEKP